MVERETRKSVIRQLFIYQSPAILYAALIYAASSFSRLPTPDIGLTFADKLFHVIEYGILSYLTARALRNPPVRFLPRSAYPLAIGLTVLYAALDEYHQSFVPGRHADAYDLLADIFGAILALFFYYIWEKRSSMSR